MRLTIAGDDGDLRVSFPHHPQMGARIQVNGAHGRRIEHTDLRSTYSYQLEAFRDAVRDRAPVETSPRAAVLQMRTLDEIYTAAGMRPRTDSL